MNDEARQSQHIKMKPSILHMAHHKAIEEGKTLGRWVEEAIEEKRKLNKRPAGNRFLPSGI